MTELKTLQWGDDIGLSELAHILRIGISLLAVVRGNLTMVGSLERFYVKKITVGLPWWYTDRNPPASLGDMGLIPCPGRFHMQPSS